jgi:hypothetical protein
MRSRRVVLYAGLGSTQMNIASFDLRNNEHA